MMCFRVLTFSVGVMLLWFACGSLDTATVTILPCDDFDYQQQVGCDGQIYPLPDTSPYVLPFAVGESFPLGLSNCSKSYHGAGRPDQYAYDFDMPKGSLFRAARSGQVYALEEKQSSAGGGVGNYVILDHEDGTYGLYLHSPKNGIKVERGERVAQGDVLGRVGQSGLAGYPHLHFIVVQGEPNWPYDGIPITFKNVVPAQVVLPSYLTVTACSY